MTDDVVLEAFLREVTPTIEELVTRALHQGHPLAEIGIVLERAFDGQIHGGCGGRTGIAAKFSRDARLTAEQRSVVTEAFRTPDASVPALLVIQGGEGCVTVGVRRLPGTLVALS